MNMTFYESIISTILVSGTPLLYSTLGEIYAERSGVMNLGVEGMMIMGAVTAFIVGKITGNLLLAVLTAILVGIALSLIHAFVSITMRGNQTVSGLALTMFGLGLSSVIGIKYVGSPGISFNPIRIPFFSQIPLLGPLFRMDALFYLSIILAVVMWYILFRTKIGIRIRACGENPAVADALGVNVSLIRYACTAIGGGLAGLGGAYLTTVSAPFWGDVMTTAGRGWIAIALVIFSFWSPLRAIVGAYLFGGIEAIQFNLQAYGIPTDILGMMPYIATIVVMIFSMSGMKRRFGAPAALGVPFVREER
ncbi:MAG: ABC transporter permease [Thermoproteota archaeon]|uniref:ABC transporter permease n=1 Tax=Candidatus Methanodesulfokora washburnensis TaxID=2478471 RepID=A0A520KML0_9CREN|nr:MAG: ABC transporter permease [Candidatus Methanodesulfokores washburnensis]TDA40648.1 MAG: ABC transporter permease [Candidatus Korarchaeota archaeon]